MSGSDSLVEILRRRQQADFVGRDGQLGLFRENLRLAPDDRRKRFVFNIHGDGGVGKTFLLQQLRRVARDEGALDAYTDEDVFGIPETMVALAGQLGKPFADFLGRYEEFDRRREQMAQDPQAPLTAWSKVTRAAVKIGLHASKALPGAAPIVDLLDPQSAAEAADQVRVYLSGKFTDSRDVRLLLDPQSAAEAADQVRVYLSGKFTDSRDVRLLLDPVRELSPVFVQCLRKAAARQPVAFPPKTPKTAPHLVSPRAQHHNELGRGRGGSRAWRHHAEGYSHRGLPRCLSLMYLRFSGRQRAWLPFSHPNLPDNVVSYPRPSLPHHPTAAIVANDGLKRTPPSITEASAGFSCAVEGGVCTLNLPPIAPVPAGVTSLMEALISLNKEVTPLMPYSF